MSAAGRHAIDVRPLPVSEHRAAARLLAAAFVPDPMMVHLVPDQDRRQRSLPVYFDSVVRLSARRGRQLGAYRDDQLVGVALEMPPGAYPFPLGQQLREWRPIRATGLRATYRHFRDLPPVDDARPAFPYAYLMFLGVAPQVQRMGAGRALLAQVTGAADRDGLPTYLVTMKPDNVEYYRTAGFEVVEEMRMGASGPATWRMLRDRPTGT